MLTFRINLVQHVEYFMIGQSLENMWDPCLFSDPLRNDLLILFLPVVERGVEERPSVQG